MRRESSTVVAVVGEVPEVLLTDVGRSSNISLVWPAGVRPKAARPADNGVADNGVAEARPAAARAAGSGPASGRAARAAAGESGNLEAAAHALREASGRASPYVLVPADPLAAVASEWSAMWDLSHGPQGSTGFEQRAGEALSAWRAGMFELPDYYLVLAPAVSGGGGHELHLGPLRAARPRRVAVVGPGDGPQQAARILDALRSLPYGPWWPPLDELIDTARHFFAGGLSEGQGPARERRPN